MGRLQRKLHENAGEFVEPGEEIRESVRVRQGVLHQQNHALVATDRNLYALRLRWPGYTRPVERLLKVPVEQADVESSETRVRVVDCRSGATREWQRLPFQDPDALVDYVRSRAAAS